MSTPSNDLFKFISLRQPSGDFSIDPAEIVTASTALELHATSSTSRDYMFSRIFHLPYRKKICSFTIESGSPDFAYLDYQHWNIICRGGINVNNSI